ncbi:MAG: alkylated DNA repair dioxygenase AlkB [Rhodothermales bacterium]|jgi:alkylated DNA repair dioxygenase AlkB
MTINYHPNSVLKPALRHIPDLIPVLTADALFSSLQKRIIWEQHTVRLFGKELDCPRLSAWYGDPDATYGYSGSAYAPRPWTAELVELKREAERAAGVVFNSALLNRYRHGQDSMGWHADDEPELGAEPVIASVSLGARRKMRFRLKSDHAYTHEVWLDHGSLLVMYGATQRDWHHSLPKTKKVQEERINLTFRRIL